MSRQRKHVPDPTGYPWQTLAQALINPMVGNAALFTFPDEEEARLVLQPLVQLLINNQRLVIERVYKVCPLEEPYFSYREIGRSFSPSLSDEPVARLHSLALRDLRRLRAYEADSSQDAAGQKAAIQAHRDSLPDGYSQVRLEDSGLASHEYYALRLARPYSVLLADYTACHPANLLLIRNFGRRRLAHLGAILRSHGFDEGAVTIEDYLSR